MYTPSFALLSLITLYFITLSTLICFVSIMTFTYDKCAYHRKTMKTDKKPKQNTTNLVPPQMSN